jgi:NAD(P)-dependent dehydrogenase (short-subunit alcohol dehydrogenase family)
MNFMTIDPEPGPRILTTGARSGIGLAAGLQLAAGGAELINREVAARPRAVSERLTASGRETTKQIQEALR